MSEHDPRFQRPTAKPEHVGKDYGRMADRRNRLDTSRWGEPDNAEGESRQFTAIIVLLVFIVVSIIMAIAKWRG